MSVIESVISGVISSVIGEVIGLKGDAGYDFQNNDDYFFQDGGEYDFN